MDTLGRPKNAVYWSILLKDILNPDETGISAILNGVLRSLRPSIVQVPVTGDDPAQLFAPRAYENDHFLEVQLVTKLLLQTYSGIGPILKRPTGLRSLEADTYIWLISSTTRGTFFESHRPKTRPRNRSDWKTTQQTLKVMYKQS